MKKVYIKDIKNGISITSTFMIMKKLYKDGNKTIFLIGDKTGNLKVSLEDEKNILKIGTVIEATGILQNFFDIKKFNKVERFNLHDFIPCIETPIENVMKDMENMCDEELKSPECIALNNYFFSNKDFVEKFKKGIGGVSQHHNYMGGLAEHTLNVMYLTKMLCYRYNCPHKEIAILSAKLHDIGKIEEYSVEGPFSFTLKGEMEGHIVIGITMLEEAFSKDPNLYSEDFKQRIKGCIVQHHGKVEYGSPKKPNTQEAYIVHLADYVDASMNKIDIIRKGIEPGNWSEYDKRIEGRLYI